MCRSIKTLRGAPATEAEIRAAALQFVRKVSGYHQPSRANAEVFGTAVDEITAAAERLLAGLSSRERDSAYELRSSGSSSTAAK